VIPAMPRLARDAKPRSSESGAIGRPASRPRSSRVRRALIAGASIKALFCSANSPTTRVVAAFVSTMSRRTDELASDAAIVPIRERAVASVRSDWRQEAIILSLPSRLAMPLVATSSCITTDLLSPMPEAYRTSVRARADALCPKVDAVFLPMARARPEVSSLATSIPLTILGRVELAVSPGLLAPRAFAVRRMPSVSFIRPATVRVTESEI